VTKAEAAKERTAEYNIARDIPVDAEMGKGRADSRLLQVNELVKIREQYDLAFLARMAKFAFIDKDGEFYTPRY
jgi:hypothetical protein